MSDMIETGRLFVCHGVLHGQVVDRFGADDDAIPYGD